MKEMSGGCLTFPFMKCPPKLNFYPQILSPPLNIRFRPHSPSSLLLSLSRPLSQDSFPMAERGQGSFPGSRQCWQDHPSSHVERRGGLCLSLPISLHLSPIARDYVF
jgi:hypothetical protein